MHSELHPVFIFPNEPTVFDFEKHSVPFEREQYGIGKYGEYRPGVYTEKQYLAGGAEARDTHLGIDLFGKVGDLVYCPGDAKLVSATYRSQPQDYGAVVIVQFLSDGLCALFGHLSKRSLDEMNGKSLIQKGDVIGYLGIEAENGGWAPHVHFQLSLQEPVDGDMPGAIQRSKFQEYSAIYPDPVAYFSNSKSLVWSVAKI